MPTFDTLQERRQRMNQQGRLFDREGNRSRYDATVERGDRQSEQLNDIAMRERLQRQQLGAEMAMQGADIQSRYGLAAQEAQARERQAAQEFGHAMAQLNSEQGFKAGESNKQRSHVKSMADFEAQLREVAASKDFKRGLERLAVEYGMSKEQAATAFERMMEGKQVDFANQQSRDQSLHGLGQQDMRLQSQLGEQAAQSQFGRDEQMEGVRSRYDMQKAEQGFGFDQARAESQFGFDTDLNKQQADLDLNRQEQYWDRYRDENRGLRELDFTQDQKAAEAEIARDKEAQFDTAINELRSRKGNLNPRGTELLNKIENGLAELDASEAEQGHEVTLHGKQQMMGLLSEAMSPQMLQKRTEKVGDLEFFYDKQGNRVPVNREPKIIPLKPEHMANGFAAVDADGRVTHVGQASRTAESVDPKEAYRQWTSDYIKNNSVVDPESLNPRPPTAQEASRQYFEMEEAWEANQRRQQGGAPQPQQGGVQQLPGQESAEVLRLKPFFDKAVAEGDELTARQLGQRMNEIRRGIPHATPQQPGPQARPGLRQPAAPQQQPNQPNRPPNAMQGFQQGGMQGGAQGGQQTTAPHPAQQLAEIAASNPEAAQAYHDLEILNGIPRDQWGEREQQAYQRSVAILQQLRGR